MTQEELQNRIEAIQYTRVVDLDRYNSIEAWREKKILDLINMHVAEVIGEDEEEWPEVNTVLVGNSAAMERNELREEMRKRAGL